MGYRFLADLVVLVHGGFVLFALLGGVLVARWRWLLWLHLPAAVWAVAVECMGGYCPLTGLELRLRVMAGERGYHGGFVEHYMEPMLYPGQIPLQYGVALGLVALAINLGAYLWVWRRLRR
jgi:hypothetical protein